MAIKKNFFKELFGSIKYQKNGPGYSIDVSFERMGEKLDRAQDALDAQVWSDIQKYMPMRTGALIAETDILNKTVRGEVYLYPPDSDYGHYQYEGIKYVDPEYGIGAFYDPDYGFWSRPGVQKIPSNEPLFYTRDTAEAHWDEVAYERHGREWLRVARRAVRY